MDLDAHLEDYGTALGWVAALARHTIPEQFDGATPCAEYSVRVLLGHLVGTARRSAGTARGQSTRAIPHVVTDVPDAQLAATYAASAEGAVEAWSTVRGPGAVVVAPWGPCTALDALRGFTVETLVHGWDLATATGQDREGCREVAHRALPHVAVPERLVGVMYEPPVAARTGDPATTRLARALGRSGP